MKITYICDVDGRNREGVEWRCVNLMHAINRNGRHKAFLLDTRLFSQNTQKAQKICEGSDILIIHRGLWGKALSVIQHWMAKDKVVIADFDEAYQLLDPLDPDYEFMQEPGDLNDAYGKPVQSSRLAQFKWGLQIVGSATVPTPLLAEDWMGYGQIEVVKDYIELDNFETFQPHQHDTLNLGWKCRISQLGSPEARGILEAIRELMAERPNVRLVLSCDQDAVMPVTGLPEDRIFYLPASDIKERLTSLAWVDIGINPLFNDYDQRTSNRTLLEYLALKIPWVASQGPAFHDLRPYGRLLDNSSSKWRHTLLDMVDHYQDYKVEATQAPYLFSLGQSIDENIHNVIGIYAKILNNLHKGFVPIPVN